MGYTIFKYFLPVVVIVGTYWLQYKIDHGAAPPEKKKTQAKYSYFLSACLLVLTSLFQYQDEHEATEDANSLEAKYNSLQDEYVAQSASINKKVESVVDSLKLLYGVENEVMKVRLSVLQDSVATQNNKVVGLYEDISNKSDFIQNTLFGDGYAFVTRGPSAVDTSVKVSFFIKNLSNHPIYNFTMKIYDYKELKKRASKYYLPARLVLSATDYQQSLLYSIGPIDINPSELYHTGFMEEEYYEYAVAVITSRNGLYYEKLLFWPDVDINKWLYYGYELYDKDLNLLKAQVPEYLSPYEDTLQIMLDKIDLKFFQSLKVTNEDEWW